MEPPVLLEISSDEDRPTLREDESVDSVSTEEDSFDSLMRDYEGLGTTPPRTRILRRERSGKDSGKHKSRSRHRQKKTIHNDKIFNRVLSHGKKYFNSHINFLLNGEVEEPEGADPLDKRRHKKSIKKTRDSERSIKLDIDISKPVDPIHCLRTMKVESSNRFLSLSCKLVKTAIQWRQSSIPDAEEKEMKNSSSARARSDFHEHFSSLIKARVNDKDTTNKRQLSEEENLYQTELKDMIWLELQAWRADRTLTQQDSYLIDARSKIPQLLDDILNYKFVNKWIDDSAMTYSNQSSDSGINLTCAPDAPCPGCYWFFCPICLESANKALAQVNSLITKLDEVEELFPSAKAFGNQFAVYKSNEFVGKLNAMFIWFNIMRHLRLKILILGKQLVTYAQEKADKNDPDSSTPEDYHGWDFTNLVTKPTRPLHSLGKYFHNSDCGDTRTYRKYIEDVLKTRGLRKAMFFLESLYLKSLKRGRIALLNPNKSNFAESIDAGDEQLMRFGYWSVEFQSMDLPSIRPAFLFISRIPLDVLHEFLVMRLENKLDKPSALSIRQLIKELKEAIRLSVINKQRYVHHCEIALEEESFEVKQKMYLNYVASFDESVYSVLKEVPLRPFAPRIGAKSRIGFSGVPSCLRRLPLGSASRLTPSGRSPRRLVSRFATHPITLSSAMADSFAMLSLPPLFDASLHPSHKSDLYLNYIVQWVNLAEHEKRQKDILEEEWKFITTNTPLIPEGESLAGIVFCNIAKTMLCNIAKCMKRSMELIKVDDPPPDEMCNFDRQRLLTSCRSLQTTCVETRDKTFRVLSLAKTLIKYLESESLLTCDKIRGPLDTLKEGLIEMWQVLKERVTTVEKCLCPLLRECENSIPVVSLCREVLHRMYKFALEYVKDIVKLLPDKRVLARDIVEFSKQWIQFVTNYCERGRGVRPRWANYGLDFLLYVTDPSVTSYLQEREFEHFKRDVNSCVAHIMGTPSTTLASPPSTLFLMPRSASPSPVISRGTSVSSPDSAIGLTFPDSDNYYYLGNNPGAATSKMSRIRSSLKSLDARLERERKKAELIGTVVASPENHLERNIKARTVNFPWQRGIKIGHGRFGKVYTAVNTSTAELMAMKEIPLQSNDLRAIRKVGLEFKMFEGIKHENLVKYYGAEVHREELLIFMELCTGGTLESVIASTECGLPEGIVRRYTLQLVSAVCVLHENNIVHRDIKPANVFLTNEGNCIKLGDFGCAVKIKANSTAPGELTGFVGTQAYMAPEVFMASASYGHGRAADIYSLGCVVIEMASGKRPWSDFESNYQIMFKVGMGETPDIPESLSDEGQDFVESCLQSNPKNRPTSLQLSHHTFLKVDSEDEHLSFCNSTLENYLKLGIKR